MTRHPCPGPSAFLSEWEFPVSRFILIFALATIYAHPLLAQTVFEKMATIHTSGSRRGHDGAKKRFEFIVPQIRDICTDLPRDTDVSDALVVVRNALERGGLLDEEEGLLGAANNFYAWISRLSGIQGRVTRDGRSTISNCQTFAALYASQRLDGQSAASIINR